jgi:hypothetical protein
VSNVTTTARSPRRARATGIVAGDVARRHGRQDLSLATRSGTHSRGSPRAYTVPGWNRAGVDMLRWHGAGARAS